MKLSKNKTFFNLNTEKNHRSLFFFLLFYSIYCALTVGKSWDEGTHLKIGKSALDYLFSFGKIDSPGFYREHYSPIYWSLKYLFTLIFPLKYQIEANHFINLAFSFSAIIGIGKLSKELFNKEVGKIVFLILFFYPAFFGHMAFNSKDMLLAFCNVWIFYLIIRYFRKQNIEEKRTSYIISLGVLSALATGLEFVFFGTLIPVFIFAIIEIFFVKKIINKNFSNQKLYLDFLKIFLIFYFLLVLFWIDVHPNIFTLPFTFFLEHVSLVTGDLMRGVPFNLLNGTYYLSWQVPKLHFLINFIYKSPEYLLACYIVFFLIIIKSNVFFKEKFEFFTYKLILITSLMLIPIVIGYVSPLIIYDGMRHFLWSIPYFCIIPGLTIYFLIKNFSSLKSKLSLIPLLILIAYFLFSFFSVTPYQYTYLNLFNGNIESRYQKFENDYWGVSIKELVKNIKFNKNKPINIAVCGAHPRVFKHLIKKGYTNLIPTKPQLADYIIMTNRTSLVSGNLTIESTNESVKLMNCFDKFKGEDIFSVKRNGLSLSIFRKKTNISNW